MAVPSYSTDLLTFNDATDATGWGEATGMTASGGCDTDTDLAIQGSICITQDRHNVGLSSQVYEGTQPAGWSAGDCFFIWTKFFAPNSLDTFANGGQRVLVGSSADNYYGFYMDGSDTYAYGGWKNYVVDPSIVAARDQTQGTPTGTWSTVGNGWNSINQVFKGNPLNTDVITWGRGELIITGGQAGDYAVFDGIALVNDATTARWGLFQDVGGSYLWKGLISIGTATTLVDFRDANVAIVIDDTLKVSSSFNRIEVNNASSNVEWTSISITKIGSISKGEFEMVDNATLTMTSCTFTDMSTFVFQSNATLTGCTFNRCDQVTQGGASITGCVFNSPSNANGAVITTSSTISSLTGNTFISDGTGHAIDLGTITATTSISWNNILDDGTGSEWTGTTGSPVTTTSTGNEAILVNVASGQTLTISIASGATVPTVQNTGLGDVNVVAGQRTFTVTVKDGATVPPVTFTDQSVNVRIEAAAGGPLTTGTEILKSLTDVNGQVSDVRSWASDQPITGWARRASSGFGAHTAGSGVTYFKEALITGTISSTGDTSITALLLSDE